ncbi:hypothetical protein CAL29_24835 [Bordetella genomosp. 10]|uniref:MaoC-like domain-containing protein n=1 Tax=Bordetella genomosp. 10 TaxID=1416804 RepID=A0A261S1Y5_9BORD|nr:MaoC family dehydratase [Bordetella genomosp. 10]OZI31161.1 hypothetical protein CAL29_24835 [Bordetella genomosp. 10]
MTTLEPRTVHISIDELASSVGQELAVSRWVLVDQDRIDRFADATGDNQWIHTDPDRASGSPFKGTVAHGLLTLSIVAALRTESIQLTDAAMSINYGLGKVRFPNPVRVNESVRARFLLREVKMISPGVLQVHWDATAERMSDRMVVCFAQPISRLTRSDPSHGATRSL